jgi:hypothetical protein
VALVEKKILPTLVGCSRVRSTFERTSENQICTNRALPCLKMQTMKSYSIFGCTVENQGIQHSLIGNEDITSGLSERYSIFEERPFGPFCSGQTDEP